MDNVGCLSRPRSIASDSGIAKLEKWFKHHSRNSRSLSTCIKTDELPEQQKQLKSELHAELIASQYFCGAEVRRVTDEFKSTSTDLNTLDCAVSALALMRKKHVHKKRETHEHQSYTIAAKDAEKSPDNFALALLSKRQVHNSQTTMGLDSDNSVNRDSSRSRNRSECHATDGLSNLNHQPGAIMGDEVGRESISAAKSSEDSPTSYTEFFASPLMHCLDREGEDTGLYEALLRDTAEFRYVVEGLGQSARGMSDVRRFWACIRADLDIIEEFDA